MLIIDGAPRTVEQVSLLDDIVEVLHVISLDSDDDALLEQRLWSRNARAYDRNAQDTARRLSEYRSLTRPVLDVYRSNDVLVSAILPDQEVFVVYADIVSSLRNNSRAQKWFS